MSPYSPSQKHKIPKNVIIFDFDGVLADSFDTFYTLIKDTMAEAGISISQNDYRKLFLDNVHKGFKKFIGDDKKHELFKKLRTANYDKYYKKYKPKLFSGVSKLLKQLDKNYIITIASSGKKSNIIGLLKNNKIHKHFDLILATNDHSKDKMINKILEKHGADPKQTIMITDTAGDVKIAKKLGLKTIAVTWGFHSPELLKKFKPDHLAKDFDGIIKFLQK